MHNIYTFFWRGEFSNWYPCEFQVEDKTYNCVEQYMMSQKALLFNDKESYDRIMSTNDPREQKKIGRHVKGFKDEIWWFESFKVVEEGVFSKFLCNGELAQKLISTKGTILVEASPYDRIWGIGYSEQEAMENCNDWGENRLGKILTYVREKYFMGKEK